MGFRISVISLVAATAVLLATFNNCSRVNQGSKDQQSLAPKGNGDFYYGKTYVAVNPGQCTDGSDVVARAQFIGIDSAHMLRENCANLATPRVIPAADIVIGSDVNQIQIAGVAFTLEGSSLVVNGGFEGGFDGWNVLGGGPVISPDAASGSWAARTVDTADWTWIQQGIHPNLYVPGRRYILRATGKVSGGIDPLRIALMVDNNVYVAELFFSSTTYETREVTFTWQAGYSWSVLLAEMVTPNGTTFANFDDISIVEAP